MGKYWMAATNAPGMWAIGEGGVEVAHVHDQKLALKIKDLLNAAEPDMKSYPTAIIIDRPQAFSDLRYRIEIRKEPGGNEIAMYRGNSDDARQVAFAFGVHPSNIRTKQV
jgi:hypothetical protein